MKTRFLMLALVVTLAGCSGLAVKATYQYPAPVAAVK